MKRENKKRIARAVHQRVQNWNLNPGSLPPSTGVRRMSAGGSKRGKPRRRVQVTQVWGTVLGTPLLLAKGSSSPVSRALSTDLFLIPFFAFLTQHFTSFCGILTQGHTSLVCVCPGQHLGLLHLPCLPVLAAVSRVLLIRGFQTPHRLPNVTMLLQFHRRDHRRIRGVEGNPSPA